MSTPVTQLLDGLTLLVQVHEGRNLVAKDRALLIGKKTTSDPYVCVYWGQRYLGQTRVQHQTLAPVWNQTFCAALDYQEANALLYTSATHQQTQIPSIILNLFDFDFFCNADPMGTIEITSSDRWNDTHRQWLKVGPGSGTNHCRNATGEVCVSILLKTRQLLRLVPGNTHRLSYPHVNIGLSWQPENGVHIDMDAALVAFDAVGEVLIKETVYFGNLQNSNQSIIHSGDDPTGEAVRDDETIEVHLDSIPLHVKCLYLLLSVATPHQTLEQIKSALIRFYHQSLPTGTKGPGICGLTPSDFGGATTLIVARLSRDLSHPQQWMLNPIEASVSPDRDFGTLISKLKSYTRDLAPSVRIDPNERIAIMRKDGVVRLRDFCPDRVVPSTVSFGLAWDVTNGVSIDLDASAICLDSNMELVDKVYFGNLQSNDHAIQHAGDQRSGDSAGDDETISVSLQMLNPRITYIGFVISSFSGQELDDIALASCHLYDTASVRDIARYSLTDARALDKHTALVMGCLYQDEGREWMLRIISKPAQGRSVHDNIEELQNFLRQNPPASPVVCVEEEEIDLSMPAFVP